MKQHLLIEACPVLHSNDPLITEKCPLHLEQSLWTIVSIISRKRSWPFRRLIKPLDLQAANNLTALSWVDTKSGPIHAPEWTCVCKSECTLNHPCFYNSTLFYKSLERSWEQAKLFKNTSLVMRQPTRHWQPYNQRPEDATGKYAYSLYRDFMTYFSMSVRMRDSFFYKHLLEYSWSLPLLLYRIDTTDLHLSASQNLWDSPWKHVDLQSTFLHGWFTVLIVSSCAQISVCEPVAIWTQYVIISLTTTSIEQYAIRLSEHLNGILSYTMATVNQ